MDGEENSEDRVRRSKRRGNPDPRVQGARSQKKKKCVGEGDHSAAVASVLASLSHKAAVNAVLDRHLAEIRSGPAGMDEGRRALWEDAAREPRPCGCDVAGTARDRRGRIIATEYGAYYDQLCVAGDLREMRTIMEGRLGQSGPAIRIERVRYKIKAGKTKWGCPIAKSILRRGSTEEKYLILAKRRRRHHCGERWMAIAMVAWDGLGSTLADHLYDSFSKLGEQGISDKRGCSKNKDDDWLCTCQGQDPGTSGASYTYGCMWSPYYCGCKYARSEIVKKFKLRLKRDPVEIETDIDDLADHLAPIVRMMAPDAYQNMTAFEDVAKECRIGRSTAEGGREGGGRPFAGVSLVSDFCAHPHTDRNNMRAGLTAVVTLTSPELRRLAGGDYEQMQSHVLPHYVASFMDEFNSRVGQKRKIKAGSVKVFKRFKQSTILSLKATAAAETREEFSDNAAAFRNRRMGGLGLALTHGSVLLECARHEVHGSTAVVNPNRHRPTRISAVFFQHRKLNFASHNAEAYHLRSAKEK